MDSRSKRTLIPAVVLVAVVLLGAVVIMLLVNRVLQTTRGPVDADPDITIIQTDDVLMTEPSPTPAARPRDGAHVTIDLLPPEGPKTQGIVRRWSARNSVEAIHDPSAKIARIRDLADSDQPLNGITVFLNAARGGNELGAVYPQSGTPEFSEKDITLKVAHEAKRALEDLGASVVLIREDDTRMGLYHRSALVGMYTIADYKVQAERLGLKADRLWDLLRNLKWIADNNIDSDGGDILSGESTSTDAKLLYDLEAQYDDALLISLQVNQSTDEERHGTHSVYMTNATEYQLANDAIEADETIEDAAEVDPIYQFRDDVNRERLARLLVSGMHEALPDLNSGDGEQRDVIQNRYSILRHNNLTSAVLFLGYLSNPQDRLLMTTESSQARMGNAIAMSVYRYYRDYPISTGD